MALCLATAIVDSQNTPKKAPCAQALDVTSTSLREHTSKVLEQSEASHQACYRCHHGARRFVLPAHATQHSPSVELPRHHAAKTHLHRCRRGHAAPPENHHHPVTAPKTMPPAGRAAPCVAIVQTWRPTSGVSPGVAPPLVNMCSKMKPS
jgi:hypothetical protein